MTSFISLIHCYKLLYHIYGMDVSVCVHIYPSAYVEVRQLAEVHSLIPPCRLQESNSSCQAR